MMAPRTILHFTSSLTARPRKQKEAPTYRCEVNVFGPRAAPTSIYIEFLGGFIFPSTSNSRQIRSKWVTTKTGERKKIPFLGRKSEHLAALDVISTLYYQALNQSNLEPVSMGAAQTIIQVLLPDRSGNWDSHNYSKPIGDWLQDVGVIENDASATIFCIKRSLLPMFGADRTTTSIIILRGTEELFRGVSLGIAHQQSLGIIAGNGSTGAKTS